MTYYVLVALEKLGIVWDVRRPPAHVVRPVPKPAVAAAAVRA